MGARRNSGALLVLLLVAAAASAHAAPSPSPSPRPPRPPIPRGGPKPLPRVLTGGGASWASERRAALARAGITGDVALSIVAQWDFETGGGSAEWNFNVGNIKAVGAQPRVDLGAAGLFRAFESLDDGVRAWLDFIQSGRFTPCWGLLQSEPTSDGWIRCLGRLGYYEISQDEYAEGWKKRRAALAKHFPITPDTIHGDLFAFLNSLRAPSK